MVSEVHFLCILQTCTQKKIFFFKNRLPLLTHVYFFLPHFLRVHKTDPTLPLRQAASFIRTDLIQYHASPLVSLFHQGPPVLTYEEPQEDLRGRAASMVRAFVAATGPRRYQGSLYTSCFCQEIRGDLCPLTFGRLRRRRRQLLFFTERVAHEF